MKLIFALVPLFLLGAARAEVWECHAGGVLGVGEPVVIAKSDDTGFGTIEVADRAYMTRFDVEGLNRKWTWGPEHDSGSTRYTFVILPSGSATYTDNRVSSGAADAGPENQTFACQEQHAARRNAQQDSNNIRQDDSVARLEDALPDGHIMHPKTERDCAKNRELFRQEQTERLVGLTDALGPETVAKLINNSEDLALSTYKACVGLLNCDSECLKQVAKELQQE